MKKIILNLILALTFVFNLQNAKVFAFDISELGDFSSRSIIMNSQNKEKITQEQKDLLYQKKLSPNAQCMIEQIKKGNIENVELLLDSKVNPNQSYLSEYPIYIAAKYNQFDILALLYDHGAKLDKGFFSELYEAVKNKNQAMAQYLLDRNARIDYKDSVTNNTILYYALKNDMIDIAQQLIDKGAGPDMKSVKLIKKKKLGYLIKDKV